MTATLRDAIYGLAVGDALGVPFEFKLRGSFHAVGMTDGGMHRQPTGTWSDDTSMTLATCASIKQRGKIDVKDITEKFRQWLHDGMFAVDGVVFDVGNTTATALAEGRGRDDERSNGNGSLMRIVPLVFVEDIKPEQVESVSAITHAHAISKEACNLYVNYAQKLMRGLSPVAVLAELQASKVFGGIETINHLTENEVASSGYVVDTLKASFWCLTTTNSYSECVLRAVNLGDDTDTVGAVAGALAGIVYGYDEIPPEWIDILRGKDIIEDSLF
jgi:ADP-ribosylglycohydrolase